MSKNKSCKQRFPLNMIPTENFLVWYFSVLSGTTSAKMSMTPVHGMHDLHRACDESRLWYYDFFTSIAYQSSINTLRHMQQILETKELVERSFLLEQSSWNLGRILSDFCFYFSIGDEKRKLKVRALVQTVAHGLAKYLCDFALISYTLRFSLNNVALRFSLTNVDFC